jgi:fermentation-respiration switch protein FrsA (DUF1100 family)
MLIALIPLLILGILLLTGYYFAIRILHPHTRMHEETYQIEKENGYVSGDLWETLAREEIRIRSPYGYQLFGYYIPYPESQKTVIISHGIAYNLDGSIKFLQQFRRRGFNVLIYDHRNHGSSGGRNTTFGYYEKYDLKAVVEYAMQKQGGVGRIGIHGESMGGAIALQYGAIDDRCAFIITDCTFSDLRELLEYRLNYDYHLPRAIFLPLADFFCRILAGMPLSAVSPLRDVSQIQTPILFIHGREDRYVPAKMSQTLYEAKTTGIRQLYLVEGARHAEAYVHDPKEYEDQVAHFLTRLGD